MMRRRANLLCSVALSFALMAPVSAQEISGGTSSGGGSVTCGAGITGCPSGPLAATDALGNGGAAITGTTYAISTTNDAAKELLFTGTSASAWTLGSPTGLSGLGFRVVNAGTAAITITATGNIVTKGVSASTTVIAAGDSADIFTGAGSTWYAVPYSSPASTALSPVKYVSGGYYWPQNTRLGPSATLTANKIYFASGFFPVPVTIAALGAKITTIGAAGNFQVAVYAADATTGLPTGAPLAATGNISTGSLFAASTTLASPVLFPAGYYWFAEMADNNTVKFAAITTDMNSGSTVTGTNASGIGVTSQTYQGPTVTFGSWPTMNATSCGTGNCTTVSGSDSTSSGVLPFFQVN
jgi:hypothetical protein